MKDYLIFLISSIAMIHLWNSSAIFKPLRDYVHQFDSNSIVHGLSSCCKCNAFWIGAFTGFCLGLPIIFCGLWSYLTVVIICKLFPHFWKEDTL